ncbi:MAG: hypothetical protein IPN73_02625 [Saprospiraceae bacterium]|nr:hypothetical protein [Saprospiraceae bacterium]
MKNVLLFCLSLFFIVPLSSQVARILFQEKIILEGNDLFSGSNLDMACGGNITINLPKSGPHQILLDRKFNIEPFDKEDRGDYVHVRWLLSKVLPVREIVIETAMLISTDNHHKSSIFKNGEEEIDKYLLEDKRFPFRSKEVQKLVAQLKSNSVDSLLDEIMALGIKNLTYVTTPAHHGGLVKALKKGKGDYIHYAELMATLCRAKGIPARVVYGYRLISYLDRDCWVEVYIEGRGWVRKYPFTYPISEYNNNPELMYISVLYDKDPIYDFAIRMGLALRMKNQLLYSTEPMHREALESYKNHELIKSDSLFRILIKEIPQYYNYYNFLGISRARQGQFDNALGLLQQAMNLSKSDEEKCYTYYAFANYSALKNEPKLAVNYLDLVLKKGCVSLEKIKKDPDLSTIAQTEEFLTLIEKYEGID